MNTDNENGICDGFEETWLDFEQRPQEDRAAETVEKDEFWE